MTRLAPRDWFFSKLFREMLKQVYAQQKKKLPEDLEAKFTKHDQSFTYCSIEDPFGAKTQTENPQEQAASNQPLSEQEVVYLIDLYKDMIEKYEVDDVLDQTYHQVAYTAKVLTQEMVEGTVPISTIIARHTDKRITKEEVKLILYRCKQLFAARIDATKIFRLLIKVSFNTGESEKID